MAHGNGARTSKQGEKQKEMQRARKEATSEHRTAAKKTRAASGLGYLRLWENRTWYQGQRTGETCIIFCFLYTLRLLKCRHCFAPIGCFMDMGSYNRIEVHLKTAVTSKGKNHSYI